MSLRSSGPLNAFSTPFFTTLLSVVLMIFSKMNRTIPFLEDEDLKDSVLYEPVKSLAPMLFPNMINVEEESEETAKSTS